LSKLSAGKVVITPKLNVLLTFALGGFEIKKNNSETNDLNVKVLQQVFKNSCVTPQRN